MRSGKHSLRETLTTIVAALFLVCGALALVPQLALGQNTPKRVLVLYWDNKDYPGNIKFDESFKAVLQQSAFSNAEYYPEYFESNRFPGETQAVSYRDYLREKYAGRDIDVIVATADPPLNFLLKYRAELFPTSPIVFVANQPPASDKLSVPPGLTGIINQSTHEQTLDLALRLHPDTKQVFVISGSPEHDKRFETVARQELQGFESKVQITYLTDLSLGDLIARTASLPKHSVALYVWQRALNEQGKQLETYEVLGRSSPAASAPMYGMGSVNLGAGIIGGYLLGPDTNGAKSAELVTRILTGTRAQDIPVEPAPNVLTFDWRQLRRWGISEHSLPPKAIVKFKEYTFWELYKWRISGVLTLLVLQTIFIGVLLFERQRRRRAKAALDRLNAELEQRIAARTAALHAKTRELETFAYSVAHDLKAPLRGIDGYSRLLLEDHFDTLNEEGRDFLNTIHTSTEEMNQLIDDLLDYSRLERRELKPHRVALQSLVKTVVEQTDRESNTRKIDFVVNVNGGEVVADAQGLGQALKNYLDNAVKFTREVQQPRIEIGSEETLNRCVLWVRDNGVGFDMKYQERIFDIFQRLHRSEDYPGTGVGLAIVRKAMERMGGRAWGESEPGRGATFYLEIPK